jgi:hypothetical protein
MSGGVRLPGLAQESIAFNTRRHCLSLLAQALGFLTQTWAEGLNGILAALLHLHTPFERAGAQHSLSPIDAGYTAVIDQWYIKMIHGDVLK